MTLSSLASKKSRIEKIIIFEDLIEEAVEEIHLFIC
jgi:hypothetical protein